MGYSEDNIIEMVVAASNNMSLFYAQDFVNYKGKTSDTNKFYTEVIAEYLCKNGALFPNIKGITREKSYYVGAHIATYNSSSNRTEEIIAMQIAKLEHLNGIGDILDYQIPLKNQQGDIAGKVDLLSYDAVNNVVRILELKCPSSEETLLRCVLEGYTYKRVVDEKKLLLDFSAKDSRIDPNRTQIKASPLIFVDSNPYKEYEDISRTHILNLMNLLDCQPITISPQVPYKIV